MSKYILTDVSIEFLWKKLFQIQAKQSFGNIKEWDLGWFIEKNENLSQDGNAWVYGNARVYGDARVFGNAQVYGDVRVYGNAWVYAKKSFTKWWFIGGDNTNKITKLTHEQIGNSYWKSHYVLGDFIIEDIVEEKEIIEELTLEEVCKRLGKTVKIVK